MNPDTARREGLALAVQMHTVTDHASGRPRPEKILLTAGEFSDWLLARAAALRLRPAPYTFEQAPGSRPVPTRTGDDHMSVTMTDTQQVSYSVEAEDSKGFQVSDTLTWSSDDNGAVVTVTPAADGMSCMFAAVAPGTANISVTDGTLSAVDVITVTAGAAASLVLTPGAVTDEPAPETPPAAS